MNTNPTNKNSPITLNANYSWSLDNKQGGHECMHLITVHVVAVYILKDVHITDIVIKAVKTMSAEQVIRSLKTKVIKYVTLHLTNCISGVE